jgi:DNA-3-methyladenine glycosylase II
VDAFRDYNVAHAGVIIADLLAVLYRHESPPTDLASTAMRAAIEKRLTAEGILKLRPSRMRSVGLSKQKTTYIRDLARLTRAGEIEFESLSNLSDAQVIECLTRVKGIGVWTAHMFLIFALRRPDILATGDLGIRTAMRKAYGLAELPAPAEMQDLARHWTPYRSVACWYLWRSLESNANL